MATRRNFFKYLGIASGAAAGGAVTAASLVASSGKSEAVKEIEDLGYSSLIINQQYGQERMRLCSDYTFCLLYTSPSPRDLSTSRMPSSA